MEVASHENAKLMLPARLVEESLAQDDSQLRLDEMCVAGAGSADYEDQGPQFDLERATNALPPLLQGPGGHSFMQQGVLEDIQHIWRSFDSQLVLWSYGNPREPTVTEYRGVTQQIVSVATARPKEFVSDISYFLVVATPVEVSLHALRFASGSDRLLDPVRTRHAVATDDVPMAAIVSDSESGRIFLGGMDGCIHEFHYYDDEVRWYGGPRKSSRSIVSWTIQSRLPSFLRKASEYVLGAEAGVKQLAIDSSRNLLFSLTSNSTVTVFRIPPNKRDASGQLEEPSLVQLCSISHTTLSSEVSRIRTQLFPGLSAAGSRPSGMAANLFGGDSAASSSSSGSSSQPQIVKLLPLRKSQGGSIVLCAVADDGTRVLLRGVFRQSNTATGPSNTSAPQATASLLQPVAGAAKGPSPGKGPPTMTGIAVHHVRFLDAGSPRLSVKDALHADGMVVLLCGAMPPSASALSLGQRTWSSSPVGAALSGSEGDKLVTLCLDVRAVAQRQSRCRSPWLTSPMGLLEQASIIELDSGASPCQVLALASRGSKLPRALQFLYGGDASSSSSARGPPVLPALELSELARQQLLPPPSFLVASNLGIHVLTRVQPLDRFRQHLLKGDLPTLRDFAQQFTAEQACALCFQLLTATTVGPQAAPREAPVGAATGGAADGGRGLGGMVVPRPASTKPDSLLTGGSRIADQSATADSAEGHARAGVRDPAEELILLHAEQLLLTPQLASQMGFVQAWPIIDPVMPQQSPLALGQAVQPRGAFRISGRLRGLCLYVSRLLRPMWLAPIMVVAWPPRTKDGNRLKRKSTEWWPSPPESAPEVQGARWRCTWTRAQRTHVLGQLEKLSGLVERCKGHLAAEDGGVQHSARGAATGFAGPAGASSMEGELARGIALLISTAIEALAFLELIAYHTDALAAAPCPAESLVRFAELSFRDLVCQPAARKVLQQLMRGGVVACRQLHAKCPKLFSAEDLEVQEACELLGLVQRSVSSARTSGSILDMARLGQLVQSALQSLLRHAGRVDLDDACVRLCAVGAYKALIALCATVARARDPRDEALRPADPTVARVQQLHYARLECYQAVLSVFEDLLARARKHQAYAGAGPGVVLGTPMSFRAGEAGAVVGDAFGSVAAASQVPELLPVPIAEADAVPALDALLRHCLEGNTKFADELFHFCILKWMKQRGLPLYRYDSPYLRNFLEVHARDQPELLCRYLQHHSRWAEACDAYMALVRESGHAGRPELSVQDKLVLLQSAELCARMPGSGRHPEVILQATRELLAGAEAAGAWTRA